MTRKKPKKEVLADDEDLFGVNDVAPAEGEVVRPQVDQVNCKYNCWPATVPILSESDMAWNYSIKNQRFDLLMWLDITFDSATIKVNPKRDEARSMLELVLAERLGLATVDLWQFLEDACDAEYPALAWQAEAWNETMRRLGFDLPDGV